jgi:hypothetical protein
MTKYKIVACHVFVGGNNTIVSFRRKEKKEFKWRSYKCKPADDIRVSIVLKFIDQFGY